MVHNCWSRRVIFPQVSHARFAPFLVPTVGSSKTSILLPCHGFVLHGIGEHLVQPGNLAGYAEIDGALANLDHKTTEHIRVHSRHGLELLTLAVLGLADGCFETSEGFLVEFLGSSINLLVLHAFFTVSEMGPEIGAASSKGIIQKHW